MRFSQTPLWSTLSERLIRPRAKVLAREDREMKAALIKVRQDSGLTQKQVADLMGVTQQAINKLERYDSDPKLSTVRRYANAVGALVSHSVTPDVGQSELLAATPRWEAAVSFRPFAVTTTHAYVGARSAQVGWADAKRTDFALAG